MSSLLQMGYQAMEHYDSGDGLHEIDVVLLPQEGIPVKVAIEADGIFHYLYEDLRLLRLPEPAVR